MSGKIETIIEVGTEGGLITLFGIESNKSWKCFCNTFDCSNAHYYLYEVPTSNRHASNAVDGIVLSIELPLSRRQWC